MASQRFNYAVAIGAFIWYAPRLGAGTRGSFGIFAANLQHHHTQNRRAGHHSAVHTAK